VIWPRFDNAYSHAGVFVLSGDAEMTGAIFANELGLLRSPLVLTGTGGIGAAHTAIMRWSSMKWPDWPVYMPVVADTMDDLLSDITAFPLQESDVVEALESAQAGPVAEGNVGGGTGMIAFSFKGGIGTASRVLSAEQGSYTVGVLVQANFGNRKNLRIGGVLVGREITDDKPIIHEDPPAEGSCIVVIATDAPVGPLELQQIARRSAIGLARVGTTAHTQSGEISIAFSTRKLETDSRTGKVKGETVSYYSLDPLYTATIEATEEAVVNALVAAETMEGNNGSKVFALPVERVKQILRNRAANR
jgi:D-aminopeptidase